MDFKYSEAFLQKLKLENKWEGLLRQLNDIETHSARVQHLLNVLMDYGALDEIKEIFQLRNNKCNQRADVLRGLGNRLFSNGKYYEAMCYYNESICFAEFESENMALVYGNRSAVFFKLKLYRECLINIHLARQAKYPVRLMKKLNAREEKCLELQKFQLPDNPIVNFPLSFKAHEKNPNVAECIKLQESERDGRSLITTRALEVGQVIATEESLCSILQPSKKYEFCTHCKKHNLLTLIPCKQCCAVMFCSEKCRRIAEATYHKYECSISNIMSDLFDEEINMTLRIWLTAVLEFPNVEELMAFCADPENQGKNTFDLDHTNPSKRERYRAILGLQTKHANLLQDDEEKYLTYYLCALLQHFLFEYTPIKDYVGTDKVVQDFFSETLVRHMLQCLLYMFTLKLRDRSENCANAVTTILPFPKHSCAPNLGRHFCGTKATIFVIRPVPANGQLSVNYGSMFLEAPRAVRLMQLRTMGLQDCQCEACINNYPFLEDLPVQRGIPSAYEDIKEIYSHTDYHYALQNYRKYAKIISQYDNKFPAQQVLDFFICLGMSIEILSHERLFKYKVSDIENANA